MRRLGAARTDEDIDYPKEYGAFRDAASGAPALHFGDAHVERGGEMLVAASDGRGVLDGLDV
jgi:hypothetical protein